MSGIILVFSGEGFKFQIVSALHMVSFISSRRPWFNKFRNVLNATGSIEGIESLLRVNVERWRGRSPRCRPTDQPDSGSSGESETPENSTFENKLLSK
ncbi:hypothetical protein M378DRAFT_167408 [Amanita muscaria Koide BX008]|uniref:Uncharacterized protein n=1 Tax=Amanita muscaria (strain Koide BX008) TaxID=946122 RepID=A0A0C2WW73_AMAMK|nr:hypothetical protein M378DRAFT_167408 [Amanita muscaria Koide BX008]